MNRKVISVRKYKIGYEVRSEEVALDDETPVIMKSAYNLDGHYIGNSVDAHRLVVQRGIMPELRPSADGECYGSVCSIGFNEAEQKWYGWSHRAIFGFGIGHKIKKGDVCASSGWTPEYLAEHPEEDQSLPIGFKAKTIDDAKMMAVAFAEGVS